MKLKPEHKFRIATAILVLLTALAGLNVRSLFPDKKFHYYSLDVGQGDAALVVTPQNVRILIDGGPGDNILQKLSQVLGALNRRIDVVILTHPDADHMEGLIPVLKRYKVGAVFRTDAQKNTAAFATFENLMRERRVSDARLYLGDKLTVNDGTSLTVLWPPAGNLNSKTNESSIVGLLSYKGYDFLTTGDIGSATERELLRMIKPEYLESHVLKIPHHGSGYSSNYEFLNLVKPKVAVISVGAKNLYGHPNSEVLSRLGALNSEVFRTDINGTVEFLIDKHLKVTSEK